MAEDQVPIDFSSFDVDNANTALEAVLSILPDIEIHLSGHFQPCPCQECARVFLEESLQERLS